MGIRAKARFGSALESALRPESLPKEVQAFPSSGREPSLEIGRRFHELLIEAGHASAAVGMLFADLQESLPRHFPPGAIEVIQDAKHHSRPTVVAAAIEPKVEAGAPGLIGRGTQEPLDPLEPSFYVK
jgi:hypothetical protein